MTASFAPSAAMTPLQSIEQFLYCEAELCDAMDWDAYIQLYDEKCEFHLPQWISETEFATDAKTQLSHIYWKSRAGLEDRIFRIRTGRAAAYRPPFRTVHMITNLRPRAAADGAWTVKANWSTHFFRTGTAGVFFGWSEYLLAPHSESWKIARKHVVILNDVVNHVLDFYHF